MEQPIAASAPSILVRVTGSAMLLSITLSATQLEQARGADDGSNRRPARHREIGHDAAPEVNAAQSYVNGVPSS